MRNANILKILDLESNACKMLYHNRVTSSALLNSLLLRNYGVNQSTNNGRISRLANAITPAALEANRSIPFCASYTTKAQEATTLNARCQCGTVSFPLPAKYIALYHCHCSHCRKQSGSAYGTSAVYPASAVLPLSHVIRQNLTVWTRPTDSGHEMDCFCCKNCSNRIFHIIRDHGNGKPGDAPRGTVSLKAGIIEGLNWDGGVHIFANSAVTKIPNDVEAYEDRPPSMPGRGEVTKRSGKTK
jgi:hypothetical protein